MKPISSPAKESKQPGDLYKRRLTKRERGKIIKNIDDAISSLAHTIPQDWEDKFDEFMKRLIASIKSNPNYQNTGMPEYIMKLYQEWKGHTLLNET